MRRLVLLLATALAAVALPADAAGPYCNAPRNLVALQTTLPRLEAALQRGHAATIVAIGSSSTSGFGASSPSHTYPAQLQAELLRRFPGAKIAVHNKGIGGETIADMLARFDRDVFALEPDLVIWQLGTNAVLRGLDLAEHDAMTRQGIERLRAAGIDVILMDMQYAPRVNERPEHRLMEQSIGDAAADARVSVFRRFEIMRYWVEHDRVEPSRLLKGDGLHLNDFSYGCIARLLAASIAARVLPSAVQAEARHR